MVDSFQREIDYIRISVTDRCNFRCGYCIPQGEFISMKHDELLTYEEIERLCGIFSKIGIHKIKLTGGEPLVRKGCVSLVKKIHQIEGIQKVTMTTNGSLLGAEQAIQLKEAGLDGVNISLDTLKPEVFQQITGRDQLPQVLNAIKESVAGGIPSVKINCVPMRGVNDSEIEAIAAIAKDLPIAVRFIEMMPIGRGRSREGMDEEEIKQILENAFGSMPLQEERLGNGPAVYYKPKDFAGSIGFISALSHKFCSVCNRIRLTSDGILKPCLQFEGTVNLRDLMRNGSCDETICDAIRKVILNKPKCHEFLDKEISGMEKPQTESKEERTMSSIGG